MGDRWVVIGAGSAGCVAAARLSERGEHEVVLLEAGPDLHAGSVPPAIDGANFLDALAVDGRLYGDLVARRVHGGAPSPYLRGRGVGGSSAVNAMVALRGDAARYRSWGWHDADEAWARVAIPAEVPTSDELGPVDRALLAATPDATPVALTRRNGRRVTSAEAYLWPAGDRDNLTVRADSPVQRIVFDGRRAIGIRLASGEEIDATDVVVAAGAIHSPAILLRSGVDTPGVGDGLQDHPSLTLTLALRDGVAVDADGLVIGSIRQVDGVQFVPMNTLGRGAGRFGAMLVALMTPHGCAGTVRIDPDEPGAEPIVDFALLDDPRDLDAMTGAVGEAFEVLREPSFAAIVDDVFVDDAGTSAATFVDSAAIRELARARVGDYVHASGTCAMGSVVDQDGRVAGYDGLYVCDASVFPSIPDVNTHLPTTMLAERLAARWSVAPR